MNKIPYGHPAWIEIDLTQFKHNLLLIKKFIGKTKFCLPIKADAYGHGLIPIAKAAVQVGVDYLAVSSLHEGALLREAHIDVPILVMGAIHEEQIPELIAYDLEFTIGSKYKAEMVQLECAKLSKTVKVHLEIDTGMHRTGIRISTAPLVLEYLGKHRCFNLVGIYSHLASSELESDNIAKHQIEEFQTFIEKYGYNKNLNVLCHLANSGGVVYFPEAHLDMVRPGLLAFGHFNHVLPKALKSLAPCFTVKAKISYFKVVSKGLGISYGHQFMTKGNTRIVTIPIGYGDGYRRALSNIGSVIIRQKKYPIVGTICMDQLMVDINLDEAYVGDTVTMVGSGGKEEITINQLAKLCHTIPYEILCGFNNRLPRIYIEKNNS